MKVAILLGTVSLNFPVVPNALSITATSPVNDIINNINYINIVLWF